MSADLHDPILTVWGDGRREYRCLADAGQLAHHFYQHTGNWLAPTMLGAPRGVWTVARRSTCGRVTGQRRLPTLNNAQPDRRTPLRAQ